MAATALSTRICWSFHGGVASWAAASSLAIKGAATKAARNSAGKVHFRIIAASWSGVARHSLIRKHAPAIGTETVSLAEAGEASFNAVAAFRYRGIMIRSIVHCRAPFDR